MACSDPRSLEGVDWLYCYLISEKHQEIYWSIGTVLWLLALTLPAMMILGFAGAMAKRSTIAPLRWFGHGYTSMVRGVPDIVFFLFVPLALDQLIELTRHVTLCPEVTGDVYRGNEFRVCDAAKTPGKDAPNEVHQAYNFGLAIVGFAIVFGAFAASVIDGALKAVPRAQLETAEAYGMSRRQVFWRVQIRQMWIFALPGLSNLWQILIKATPLLTLLGVEDLVYWANELGKENVNRFSAYRHPDWRLWYFGALLVFYLGLTWVSEIVFARLTRWAARGQATAAGADTGPRRNRWRGAP